MAVGQTGISDKTINTLDRYKIGGITLGVALAALATVVFIIGTYKTGKLTDIQLKKLKAEGYDENTLVDTTISDIENLIGVNKQNQTTTQNT